MSFAIEKEVEGVTYVIEVFSSMFIDWGLVISRKDEDGNPLEEAREWTKEEWEECLRGEATDLIEAYVDWEKSGENS